MRKYQARFGGGPTEKDQQWYLASGLPDTSDGRKAALDIRLVKPDAPRPPHSKVMAIVENVVKIYHETRDTLGVQLCFIDLSTPKSKKG